MADWYNAKRLDEMSRGIPARFDVRNFVYFAWQCGNWIKIRHGRSLPQYMRLRQYYHPRYSDAISARRLYMDGLIQESDYLATVGNARRVRTDGYPTGIHQSAHRIARFILNEDADVGYLARQILSLVEHLSPDDGFVVDFNLRWLLQELFGHLHFCPQIDQSCILWCDRTVQRIAENIAMTGSYSSLPILADSLEEAGCIDVGLLNHLRDTSILHIRGCWALETVLGRK